MDHGGGAMTENPFGSDEPRAGQDAAKLLAAAQDWLRTSAPHLAPVDADGTTCTCPVCRAVAGVRDADPDVVGRWVDSALAAATTVLTQAGEKLASTADAAAGAAADGSQGDEDTTWSDYVVDLDEDADLEADDEPDAHHDDESPAAERSAGAAGQDDQGARGVRRIPLEQTDPGDLDG